MECNLNVVEYRNSEHPFPRFTRPQILGYFSVDKDRNFVNDKSMLQFLHMPPNCKNVYYNLKNGYHNAICKDVNAPSEKIDHLLKFISLNSQKLCESNIKGKLLKADVICFRGLLTSLMCTPFEKNEGWIILATNWKGTTYICAWETEKQKQDRLKKMKYIKKFMSWGFKFEQYMLSSSPNIKPDPSKPVIESEEFCCIFNSKLGNNNLLYGAEMDGVDLRGKKENLNEFKLENAKFIELKTNKTIMTSTQDRNFKKHKSLKWWCQSFLVGIEEILCGCRDDNGIVHEVKSYPVKNLSKENDNLWQANASMNFCNDIVSFIHSVSKKNQNEVLRFEWIPGTSIKYEPDYVNHILPTWYLEAMKPL